ncbi:hypothetical protein [Agrobacterium arsenijevicii]|uniref:Uncharacterized protein n=1 Tax=Agrobacterium arsenijevicii TaxID=1585697 RepID=A0ABR5CZJ8_9HYPH|nr:hypothetical protein RP75_27785 [Agrobacterium arsenijevicii]
MASLSLRSQTNSFDDGFDLALTAFTKGDYLTLNIGSAQVEVLCEILQFEVDLLFYNASVRHGPAYETLLKANPRKATEKITEKNSQRKGLDFGLKASSKSLDFTGDVGRANNMATEVERSSVSEQTEYMHIEISCLSAGDHTNPRPLKGTIIQDYAGWHVIPKTLTERSGALARFRVRRPWIKFSWARPRLGVDKISSALGKLFGAETEADRLKLAMFPALLEKLVHMRLQEKGEREFATLAAACLVVKPHEQSHYNIPSEVERAPIEIDLTVVENFLEMDAVDAKNYLKAIENAKPTEARNTVKRMKALAKSVDDDSLPKPETQHWFPASEPRYLVSAIKSFQRQILKKKKPTIDGVDNYLIVEDLKRMGIIDVKDGVIVDLKIDPSDPVAPELARYASQVLVLKHAMAAYRKLGGNHMVAPVGTDHEEIPEFEDVVSLVTTLEVHLQFDNAELTEVELEQHLQEWCSFIEENE